MKIALFTDGIYPYVIGGMQRHSFYLAKYFALNGIYVDLYHTSFRDPKTRNIESVDCFSEAEKIYIRSFLIDFPDFGKLPGHYIRESFEYSKRIFEIFKKNSDVDFVYAKGFTAWKLIEEKKKGFKSPLVGVKFHGMNMFDKAYSFKSKMVQYLLRSPTIFNLNNADYVFSYGGKITDLLLKNARIHMKKIIEIPTGVDERWLNDDIWVPSTIRKFIFVGRYDKIKGIEELVQSIKQLQEYNFEFHFVGHIPEKLKINSKNIIYHGSVSETEKLKVILRGCDVLVCPSYSEGMPNVILEAMASGLAIIATDVGAVCKMVSNENGWLLNYPEPEKIKSVIINAIKVSENNLLNMKFNSIKKVKDYFLWNKIILQTIESIKNKISIL